MSRCRHVHVRGRHPNGVGAGTFSFTPDLNFPAERQTRVCEAHTAEQYQPRGMM
jgi:hypothetical protein